MKTIPLTKGYVALIDDEDFELVSQYSWVANVHKEKTYDRIYAFAAVKGQKKRKVVYLHRLIMNPEKGQYVDHINDDGRDNRRYNLRVCSPTNNTTRRRKTKGTTSRFIGVSRFSQGQTWNPPRQWQAGIGIRGHRYGLGYFETEEEAALHYDIAAQLFFGEFTRLNGV